jgi:hypothetical protein
MLDQEKVAAALFQHFPRQQGLPNREQQGHQGRKGPYIGNTLSRPIVFNVLWYDEP